MYTFNTMDDTQKMLRVIINGQSSFRQELLSRLDKVEKRLDGRMDSLESKIDGLDGKIDGVEGRLTKRLDKIGNQLAYLEDDTPTKEEFDNLVGRVGNLEQKPTPVV